MLLVFKMILIINATSTQLRKLGIDHGPFSYNRIGFNNVKIYFFKPEVF
jgi:hypothetical protein